MRALRITVPASRDLEEISDDFLKRSVDAGDRFVQAFSQKCQNIARFPFIGKPYDQVRLGLRGLVIMGYIVFHSVSDNEVNILRVVSGYHDLQDIFSE